MEHGYELRFIEQMPLDAQHGWQRTDMVTAEEILAALRTRFDLTPEGESARGSAPAERWLVDGGPARVGVIASVTRPFCRACDRTRLTADGQVRNCLFAREESDLRGALRSGAPDERDRRAAGRRRCGARRRAPGWTTRPSSSRTARCPRSAADGVARPAECRRTVGGLPGGGPAGAPRPALRRRPPGPSAPTPPASPRP